MIKRHSSRRNRLDEAVLNERLDGAVSYDRIAGYFRSSLFEVAGEALSKVTGPVQDRLQLGPGPAGLGYRDGGTGCAQAKLVLR